MERLGDRLERAFLAFLVILFTVAGLALLIDGDGTDRWVGLLLVLFFGVGGSFMVLRTRLGRRMDPVHTGWVTWRAVRRPALVFPLVRSRILLAGIAGLGMGAAGLIMAALAGSLADPGESGDWPRFVGVVAALLFGGMGLIQLRHGFGRGQVALTPEGVLFRGPGSYFVPWEAITEVGLYEVRGTPILGLNVSDPSAVETSVPRWLQKLNREMSDWDVSIPVVMVAVEPEVLDSTVRHYLREPAARAQLGTPASEARLGSAADPPR